VPCAPRAGAGRGPWGRSTVEERATALHRVADVIERRFDDFLAAEIADTGRPLAQARKLDVYRGIANFRTFADLGKTAHGDFFETNLADGTRLINYTTRKPLGVVASISPWNLPILSLTWKAAPALICGNAIVCKPSEETPSSATLIAEAFDEAACRRACSTWCTASARLAGEALTRHPGIDAVTFTGESRTGAAIMRTVADGVKEVSFELGGKNAAIVFADCDFDAAVEGVIRSSFTNTGQVCLCSERVCGAADLRALRRRAEGAHRGPEDRLARRAGRGHGLADLARAPREGAVVLPAGRRGRRHRGRRRRRAAFRRRARWRRLRATHHLDRPARRRALPERGGVRPGVPPCPLRQRRRGAAARQRQRLRPGCQRVDHQPLARTPRRPRLHVGIVWVNTWFSRDLRTPFGGVKLSGIGREGGRWSLDFYSETSNICIKV
jgi:aminomuconate-semialdehyde/2-hydroxymuconate-6-semialdehyde dehydrogenase